MAAPMNETVYHRRLDRGPEKEEFKRLSKDDKQLISQLRSAMEGTREKMTTLRDDVDNRERDMSREQALRRAAEQRLEQLVDMYGDPAVLEELRDRLPRAGKDDPKRRWQSELDDMVKQQQTDGQQSTGARSAELDSEVYPDVDTASSRRSRSAESRRKRGGSSTEDTAQGSSRRRSHSPPPPGSHTGYPAHYPPAGYHPGYPAGYPYPYAAPPPVYAYPGFAPGLQGGVMAQNQPGATAGGGGGHIPGAPGGVAGAMGGAAPGGMGVTYFPTNQNPAFLSAQSSGGLEGAAAGASRGGSGAMAGATGGASGAAGAASNREQTKQIALLLAELDAAKELNKKLQAKLQETEKELESLKLAEATREVRTQAEIASKAGDLVEEIYRAQQERDQAMLGRLRIANEERDVAITQLRAAQRSTDQYDAETLELATDLDLKDVLNGLESSDNPASINQSGKTLVDAINSTRRRRRLVTTEEMRAVLQERDTAVNKSQKLETELVTLQRVHRARSSDPHQAATMQAKLLATQQERDMALAKVRGLEDELQTLRIFYSLHKSLSQEANMRDQFNNTLENYEGQLKQREQIVMVAQKQNNSLASQLQDALEERVSMAEQLAKAQAGQRDAEDNQRKLERLVNVLRRKVNGLGSKSED